MYEFNVGTDANFSPGTYSTCLTNHTVVSPYNSRALRRHSAARRQTWTRGQLLLLACPRGRRPHPLHAEPPRHYGVFSQVRSLLYDARFVCADCPPPTGQPGRRASPHAGRPADNISRYKVTISPVVPLTVAGSAQ